MCRSALVHSRLSRARIIPYRRRQCRGHTAVRRGESMTMSRNALQFCAALGALLYGTAAPAQGLLTEHRLSAGLANEAVAEAVAACAKNGYTVTAIVVDIDGVRQAVLRGDGAPVHTLDSAYAKAYTAASLAPVRKDGSTKGLSERIAKTPGVTTAGLASL